MIELKGRYERDYILGPGDRLAILAHRVPDASFEAVIRPDGMISAPLIEPVKAAGLTVRELDDLLTGLYSQRLAGAEITVSTVSVREPMIYVVGEVSRPGPVPYRDAPTALAALSYAGGFLDSAAPGAATIIRLHVDGMLRMHVAAAPVGGQAGPLLALAAESLEPEDVLFVPEAGLSQFNRILGQAVSAPAGAVSSLLTPVLLALSTYLQFTLLSTGP